MKERPVTRATLGRLPQYLQLLRKLRDENVQNISATAIAGRLSLGEVQVRKDLCAVSGAGRPRIGYEICGLIESLEKILRYDKCTSAVLVGAGKLGKALLEYDEFEEYGVKIIAAFDCNEHILKKGGSTEILPLNNFESFCKTNNVQIGIITVGAGSAQDVCDLMIRNGISAIWNFAPCKLNVSENVILKQEKLALSLAHLNNLLLRI
jgi:redox-sensing transcriptional repressor